MSLKGGLDCTHRKTTRWIWTALNANDCSVLRSCSGPGARAAVSWVCGESGPGFVKQSPLHFPPSRPALPTQGTEGRGRMGLWGVKLDTAHWVGSWIWTLSPVLTLTPSREVTPMSPSCWPIGLGNCHHCHEVTSVKTNEIKVWLLYCFPKAKHGVLFAYPRTVFFCFFRISPLSLFQTLHKPHIHIVCALVITSLLWWGFPWWGMCNINAIWPYCSRVQNQLIIISSWIPVKQFV